MRSAESLWSIAERELERRQLPHDVQSIDAYTDRLHRKNIDVVGREPDLIFPGEKLDVACDDIR